jgi:THO complex subunit 1
MVDTVLSRDKNWVRWKNEACPPFQKESTKAEEFSSARNAAQKAFANKRLRPNPVGALDLNFLVEEDGVDGLESLKNPDRYQVPDLSTFRRPIEDDQFDLEMGRTDEEKSLASNAKASKLWRALRIASKSKLAILEKLDDGKNLDALFGSEKKEGEDVEETLAEGVADKEDSEDKKDQELEAGTPDPSVEAVPPIGVVV